MAAKKAASSGGAETTGALLSGDDARDAGWFGSRNNLHADEEFALTSGPESPGATETDATDDSGGAKSEAPAGD
jgi:hypothetical protein